MTQNKKTSDVWWKEINNQPYDLTVTMEGTGSGSAYLLGNKIVATLSAAQVSKYVNISTPLGFTVRDVRIRHDNATASALQLKNTSQAITDAISVAASDTDIDRAGEIDDTSPSFNKGDDDLRIAVTTGAFTGVVEIIIEPTIA